MPTRAAFTSRNVAEGGRAGPPLVRLELGDARWRKFVGGHADAQPSHHPEWACLLAECYALEPFVLAAMSEAGEVLAGLPVIAVGGHLQRRWISLPFTDYCPPLLGPQATQSSMTAAIDAARRAGDVASIEVRAALDTEAPPPPVGLRHVLELPGDPAHAFERFHHSHVQRAIRRVERDRVLELRVASSRDELSDVFYRLHLDARRRHGTPVQPRRFFRLLWERMIEPGLGFVLLAYADRTAVAGAVFLRSDSALLYKYAAGCQLSSSGRGTQPRTARDTRVAGPRHTHARQTPAHRDHQSTNPPRDGIGFSTLKRPMRLEDRLAKTLPGLAQRVIQRLLGLTLAILLNTLLGRPPRALAGYDGR